MAISKSSIPQNKPQITYEILITKYGTFWNAARNIIIITAGVILFCSFFSLSFSQVKLLRSIENIYPHDIQLIFQSIVGDQYNQKPCRGMPEEQYHDHQY